MQENIYSAVNVLVIFSSFLFNLNIIYFTTRLLPNRVITSFVNQILRNDLSRFLLLFLLFEKKKSSNFLVKALF